LFIVTPAKAGVHGGCKLDQWVIGTAGAKEAPSQSLDCGFGLRRNDEERNT
jgi:hypothetical protein